jgi:Amt family ammonium transporter
MNPVEVEVTRLIRKSHIFVKKLGGDIMIKKIGGLLVLTLVFIELFSSSAFAADKVGDTLASLQIQVDTVWTLIAAFLVFLMQAGFALLEGGLTRAKNVGNIMMKNIMDFGIASLAYWAVGFAIMFGAGNALYGASGWFVNVAADRVDTVFASLSWTGIPLMAKWFFQLVFAGTAATIVSGAMAERTKFKAYLIYSAIISGFIYPIVGHWIWGGGWLGSMGFQDFAGSTVVHSVGGWAALAGVLVIGPRLGKYGKDGKVNPIPGHSMPLAILGVFILWFGWFGFNPGSTMGASSLTFPEIAVTTNLAAAAAALAGMLTAWIVIGKPDISLTGGAAIGGLVAITSPCAFVENWAAVLIGAMAGSLYVFAVLFIDKIKIDDPVGAIPAHAFMGMFGTLAAGVFASPRLVEITGVGKAGLVYTGKFDQLIVQGIGALAVLGFVFVSSFVMFKIIKVTVGLRVSAEEELQGLDIHEHGMWGYPEQFVADLPVSIAGHYPTPGESNYELAGRLTNGAAQPQGGR